MPAHIRFVGDTLKLERWERNLRQLANRRMMRELSEDLAEETLNLVNEGFRGEHDPYQNKWKAKKLDDGRMILVGKTARLRRSWHRAKASPRGMKVRSGVGYSGYHQTGTGRMVARRMVPTSELGIPRTWALAYRDIVYDHIAKTLNV